MPKSVANARERLEKLAAVKERYESLCRRRRSVLENREVPALHTRTESYREIRDRFSAVIDDYDDCEVILDAHHVAAAIDEVVLYTGDYRHIVANRDLILPATHLHDCPVSGRADGRELKDLGAARMSRRRNCTGSAP